LGPNPADPWTLHWILATGSELDPWFALLDATPLSPVLHLAEAMQVTLLIDEIHRSLADNPGILSLLRASRALAHLLAVALHHHHPPEGDSAVSRRIGHCIEYLTTHLDQPLRIAALAHLAHLSPARFSVLFRSFTGSPPRDYLHLVRMHRACQWLTDTTLPLKTIAAQLGYQDQFHFSRKFKAFAGLPPGAYRTTHRQTQVRTS
jgi:AraC-like DNA-binding protein